MDKYDLETKISQLSTFADLIRNLSFSIGENHLSKDEILNGLEGLSILIESYERSLFDTFIRVHKLDQYH